MPYHKIMCVHDMSHMLNLHLHFLIDLKWSHWVHHIIQDLLSRPHVIHSDKQKTYIHIPNYTQYVLYVYISIYTLTISDIYNKSDWWCHHLLKILVRRDDYPNIWENKTCSKPPTSSVAQPSIAYTPDSWGPISTLFIICSYNV